MEAFNVCRTSFESKIEANWQSIFVYIGSILYCSNRNVQKMWPIKVQFDWPLVKNGLKMANVILCTAHHPGS